MVHSLPPSPFSPKKTSVRQGELQSDTEILQAKAIAPDFHDYHGIETPVEKQPVPLSSKATGIEIDV
jgi:hypothetical protein